MVPRPLVVRLCNWIGDVVLGLPTLQRLHDAGYALQLYGKGWAHPLLRAYPWPITTRAGSLRERVAQLRTLRQQALAQDPALGRRVSALAMPNSFSSALEMRLAGLGVAGLARDGRSLLLRQRIAPAAGPHALEGFWALADGLLGSHQPLPERIDMRLAPAAQERARALVAARGWGGGYVCIAPFAAGVFEKQDKRWPAFPEFSRQLAAFGLPLVVCPGPGEEAVAHADYGHAQVIDKLPLDDYAALLSGARLVVANDTGPAHLAAATGAPLISVLGPTKVAQWRPWGPTVQVVNNHGQWPAVPSVLDAARARLQTAPVQVA